MSRYTCMWCMGAAFSVALGASASAQPSNTRDTAGASTQLEEIIVTAEKRAVNLQDVPTTVSAVTADDLQRSGRQSLSDLVALIPGVTFTSTVGGNFIVVRGVGNIQANFGIESPVATYVDGVYLFNSHASMMSFNDIARIEVLKGPQGTLFGRNATGGVVQVVTKEPSKAQSVDADVAYGNYNTVEGRFYGTSGIGESWAGSLALYGKKRMDGYGRNFTTGEETYQESRFAAHGKLLYASADGETRLTINGLYDYAIKPEATYSIFPGFRASDFSSNIGYFNTEARINGDSKTNQGLFSIKLERDLGWAEFMGLVSEHVMDKHTYSSNFISGNRVSPLTGRVVPLNYAEFFLKGATQTAELQLQSPEGNDFRWVVGAFLLKDVSKTEQNTYLNDAVTARLHSKLTTESASVFAQATKTILPQTELTLGVRYTHDRHEISGRNTGNPRSPEAGGIRTSISESEPTYRVSLSHHFTDHVMAYASYNTGFRSGRYVNNNFTNPPVMPETIDAYEAGLKSELFDRRIRLNVSAYHFDYKNLQVRATNEVGVSRTLNAAKARGRGVDLDFDALVTSNLRFGGGVSYVNAEYTRFPRAPCPTYNPVTATINANAICDLSGTRLPRSPVWSATLRASYTVPTAHGEFLFSAEDGFSSSYRFEPDGTLVQPSFHNVSASATWTAPSEHWWARIWVRNVLNERIYTTGGTGSSFVYTAGDPRLYGVTVGARF